MTPPYPHQLPAGAMAQPASAPAAPPLMPRSLCPHCRHPCSYSLRSSGPASEGSESPKKLLQGAVLAPLCHRAEAKIPALNRTEATPSSDSPVPSSLNQQTQGQDYWDLQVLLRGLHRVVLPDRYQAGWLQSRLMGMGLRDHHNVQCLSFPICQKVLLHSARTQDGSTQRGGNPPLRGCRVFGVHSPKLLNMSIFPAA